ncbi:hypothetical protein [Spirosoma oryzicola]|uniref:hypothetical protein n=1 Tax=Spirosoma oryzicola TaxID=2898794 RepID=UPI001E3BECF0|nr:hypothetical protein [Spirosoma oryzicola]UHG93456.1 hypothetical protein LQ777_11240 [Spirosoma oryzicola]
MESPRSNRPTSIGQLVQPVFNPEVQPQTQQPSEGNSSTFIKNFGKFERPGSTYSWKIYRPRLQTLYGYSKPFGMAEKANKQELLLNCITRLKPKYIVEGYRIDFYRNFSDDDNDSVKLMSLYGTRFMPEPVIITEAWLMKFLKDLYNPIVYNYGTEMFPTGGKSNAPNGTAIIPDSSKQAAVKDPFDPSRTFKNEDALMKYMEKLLREGHPHGQVQEFFRVKIQAFHTRPV